MRALDSRALIRKKNNPNYIKKALSALSMPRKICFLRLTTMICRSVKCLLVEKEFATYLHIIRYNLQRQVRRPRKTRPLRVTNGRTEKKPLIEMLIGD